MVKTKTVKKNLIKWGRENHYLFNKPASKWNGYDKSNYKGLLRNKGNIR